MLRLPFVLAGYFLKMHLRDRQAIVLSLVFPIIFMFALGIAGNGERDPINVGIVDLSRSSLAEKLIGSLEDDGVFNVKRGEESALRKGLIDGDIRMLLILPPDLQSTGGNNNIRVLVDAAQLRQLSLVLPALEKALVRVERSLRGTDPMFTMVVEDVKVRSQGYLEFLLPGLLAFTLMQISVAGSGFNLVEYRRKGILKRLFVTPVTPRDFILGLVFARLLLCLVQLSVLLGIAVMFLGASINGDYASLYAVIILSTIMFLILGFCLGSIAKTQQSIMAIGNLFIFPQIILSGVFFPIDSLPQLLQPVAAALPLSFTATALRQIANDGVTLLGVLPQLAGLGVWMVVGLALATRLFVWKEVAH